MKSKKMFCEVFYFKDLKPEAKKKAIKWYGELYNDFPFLEEEMVYFIEAQLTEAGYTIDTPVEVFYSLSYSQGDGVSFTAVLSKNGQTYEVNQSGRYVHEYTMGVYHETEDGEEMEEKAILDEMRSIAKKAEKKGYEAIEYETSDESIAESIEANEYTFDASGRRVNASE